MRVLSKSLAAMVAAAMPPMLPTATHSCAKALPCLARGKMTPPVPARMAMA